MNTKITKILLVLGTLVMSHVALASNDGDHDEVVGAHSDGHELEAGPNGGRLIEKDSLKYEFLFTDDRLIEIRFLDEDGSVIKPQDQEVSVTGGNRSAPTRLSFSVVGDAFVSEGSFPEGNSLPVIIEIKPSPETSVVRDRFSLSLGACPSCAYQEYACICGH